MATWASFLFELEPEGPHAAALRRLEAKRSTDVVAVFAAGDLPRGLRQIGSRRHFSGLARCVAYGHCRRWARGIRAAVQAPRVRGDSVRTVPKNTPAHWAP